MLLRSLVPCFHQMSAATVKDKHAQNDLLNTETVEPRSSRGTPEGQDQVFVNGSAVLQIVMDFTVES